MHWPMPGCLRSASESEPPQPVPAGAGLVPTDLCTPPAAPRGRMIEERPPASDIGTPPHPPQILWTSQQLQTVGRQLGQKRLEPTAPDQPFTSKLHARALLTGQFAQPVTGARFAWARDVALLGRSQRARDERTDRDRPVEMGAIKGPSVVDHPSPADPLGQVSRATEQIDREVRRAELRRDEVHTQSVVLEDDRHHRSLPDRGHRPRKLSTAWPGAGGELRTVKRMLRDQRQQTCADYRRGIYVSRFLWSPLPGSRISLPTSAWMSRRRSDAPAAGSRPRARRRSPVA